MTAQPTSRARRCVSGAPGVLAEAARGSVGQAVILYEAALGVGIAALFAAGAAQAQSAETEAIEPASADAQTVEEIVVVGSRIEGGKVVKQHPLCPWPQHPHYNGSGDSEKAENFSCQQ